MAYSGEPIPMIGGARMKPLRRPGERLRRRKSTAALLSDFLALRKCVLLCAPCERKMPRRWEGRYGYRLLHDMHTEGTCDAQWTGCEGYAKCNLYHHLEGDYVRQWDEGNAVVAAARQQRRELRTTGRIAALT